MTSENKRLITKLPIWPGFVFDPKGGERSLSAWCLFLFLLKQKSHMKGPHLAFPPFEKRLQQVLPEEEMVLGCGCGLPPPPFPEFIFTFLAM